MAGLRNSIRRDDPTPVVGLVPVRDAVSHTDPLSVTREVRGQPLPLTSRRRRFAHRDAWPRRSRPLMLDMRVIFMDVPVGCWGLPSVEMETLLWRSTNPV